MMVWAIVAIGALSFVVWAHHMYVSGMNPYFGFFFATTTLIIAVPTAIKVYNWVLTLWRGDIHLHGADAVRDRLHLHLHPRRPDRACSSATSRSTCRCRTPTSWSRTSTW